MARNRDNLWVTLTPNSQIRSESGQVGGDTDPFWLNASVVPTVPSVVAPDDGCWLSNSSGIEMLASFSRRALLDFAKHQDASTMTLRQGLMATQRRGSLSKPLVKQVSNLDLCYEVLRHVTPRFVDETELEAVVAIPPSIRASLGEHGDGEHHIMGLFLGAVRGGSVRAPSPPAASGRLRPQGGCRLGPKVVPPWGFIHWLPILRSPGCHASRGTVLSQCTSPSSGGAGCWPHVGGVCPGLFLAGGAGRSPASRRPDLLRPDDRGPLPVSRPRGA